MLQHLLEGRGWIVLRPAVDLLLLCAAVTIALGGVSGVLHVPPSRAPLLAMPVLVMVLLFLRGLYRTRLRALVLDSIVPVISAVSVAAMGVALIGALSTGDVPPHVYWLRAWLMAMAMVWLGRALTSIAQRAARKRGLAGKPVLIMGAGQIGSQVARRLEGHPEYGLVPIGFLDDDPPSVSQVGGRDVPVLGSARAVDEIVASTGVKNLIVAFSSVADARISRLIQHCQQLGIEVSVVPRMFDTINDRIGYDTVGGLPLLSFSGVDPKGVQFALKHAIDRLAAAALLVLLAPLLLGAALAVRISSPGPVFFRQRRVGRDGAEFDLYKFRSMRLTPVRVEAVGVGTGAEAVGVGGVEVCGLAGVEAELVPVGAGAQADATEAGADELELALPFDTAPGGVEGEDRRTLVGRLLRRTSLDELPQLFNVLRGDMSLIGPRPERPEFVELFGRGVYRYIDRHRVKSGITGWAQVHGLRGQTSLAERVELDNYYIAHWSLGLDLKIALLTFAALFRNAD